jgi:hypothetical protein
LALARLRRLLAHWRAALRLRVLRRLALRRLQLRAQSKATRRAFGCWVGVAAAAREKAWKAEQSRRSIEWANFRAQACAVLQRLHARAALHSAWRRWQWRRARARKATQLLRLVALRAAERLIAYARVAFGTWTARAEAVACQQRASRALEAWLQRSHRTTARLALARAFGSWRGVTHTNTVCRSALGTAVASAQSRRVARRALCLWKLAARRRRVLSKLLWARARHLLGSALHRWRVSSTQAVQIGLESSLVEQAMEITRLRAALVQQHGQHQVTIINHREYVW